MVRPILRNGLGGLLLVAAALCLVSCESETTLKRVSGHGFFNPPEIDFGTRTIDRTHKLTTIFANSSAQDLFVKEVSSDPHLNEYTIKTVNSQPLRGVSLPRGQNIELIASFHASALGDYNTTMLVEFENLVVELPIKGKAREVDEARPALSPNQVQFLNIEIGRDAHKLVTVRNDGDADGQLERIISRTYQSRFSVTALGGSPLPLPSDAMAPGESMDVELHFEPETSDAVEEELEFVFDSDKGAMLGVTGAGITPGTLSCTPPAINFGEVPRGDVVTEDINCEAINGPYVLEGISFAGGSSTRFSVPNPPSSLDINNRMTIKVHFESLGLPDQHDGAVLIRAAHEAVTRIAVRATTVSPVPGTGDINVVLSWNTPYSDFDLHLVRVGGMPFETGNDCYYSQKNPDWGAPIYEGDDPFLDQDETSGYGPEQINLNAVSETQFNLFVHYHNYSRTSAPPTTVTTTVKIRAGSPEDFHKDMITCGEMWHVGRFEFSGSNATFVPVDELSDIYRLRADPKCH